MPPLLGTVVVSACLGALIGLIRQWSRQTTTANNKDDFGGVRTYSLWALLGSLAAYASREHSTFVLPVVVGALAVHLALSKINGKVVGTTRFASALLTVLVGSLVAWNQIQAAALVAAMTMVIVGIKEPLHDWTRRFNREDIRATLQFVAISGVILPLVPNRTFGPCDGFNPYKTWMMVILISGMGFSGYIAMRLWGARAGILLTSVLGGLASSTASTLAFSRRSKEQPDLSIHYAFAIVVACTIMIPRVIVSVAVVDPRLATAVAPALGLMALPAFAYALWWWFGKKAHRDGETSPAIGNPLNLKTAIKFALLYSVIAYGVKVATQLEWHAGLLPLSFFSGLTDMDAISLSMAGSHRDGSVNLTLAAQAVLLGASANSWMKAGLAVGFGSPTLKKHVAVVLGLTAVVGLMACWMLAGRVEGLNR